MFRADRGFSRLNPAAIILSKQLPLFCAELQIISRPRSPASDVFTLYEVTGRILEAWEDLCPGYVSGISSLAPDTWTA